MQTRAKTYAVKEVFYTIQCEGANTGRPAVFLRFAGCNLWSGREEDRKSAVCSFCDTDFVGTDGPGGGRFGSADELAAAVADKWPGCDPTREGDPLTPNRPLVVCTGGEPLLQLDTPLIDALHQRSFHIAVETNGTIQAPPALDWICVSPKAGAKLAQTKGHELKLVYPQEAAPPELFEDLDFRHFFLQPMDGPELQRNIRLAVQYCLSNPKWRLSLQTHKIIGIP